MVRYQRMSSWTKRIQQYWLLEEGARGKVPFPFWFYVCNQNKHKQTLHLCALHPFCPTKLFIPPELFVLFTTFHPQLCFVLLGYQLFLEEKTEQSDMLLCFTPQTILQIQSEIFPRFSSVSVRLVCIQEISIGLGSGL